MAGRTVRAFGRRRFNYTAVQLPNSASVEVTMAERLDVSGWKTIELVARLHTGTLANGQKMEIVAYPDGFTDEDPAQFFRSGGVGTASFVFNNPLAPGLVLAGLTAPFGPMIAITARVQQAAGAVAYDVAVSCDVTMRDC